MKVLIIEDEDFAAVKLEAMLKEIDPAIEVAGKPGSIKEAVKWLLENKADLLFLDIQLSDGISFAIFEQVSVNTPVIFTTAYDQYAIKAFKLNSISYLLKPIRKRELEESLRKYHSLKSAFRIDFDDLLNRLQNREQEYKKRFLIQIGEKIKKVETAEVAYFYSMDKAVFMCTFKGSSYPVEYSLDKLEHLVSPENFFRINRKFLVNMNAISHMVAYSRGRVKLNLTPKPEEGDPVVSIERSAGFKKWMNG